MKKKTFLLSLTLLIIVTYSLTGFARRSVHPLNSFDSGCSVEGSNCE